MKRKIIFCLVETIKISDSNSSSSSSDISQLNDSSENCNWTDEEDALFSFNETFNFWKKKKS